MDTTNKLAEEAKRLAFKYAERFHEFQNFATAEREHDLKVFRTALDDAIDRLAEQATQAVSEPVAQPAEAVARTFCNGQETQRMGDWLLSQAPMARDTERLNWLQINFRSVSMTFDCENKRYFYVEGVKGSRQYLRDAIDAALAVELKED